jgi:hypothetical protein
LPSVAKVRLKAQADPAAFATRLAAAELEHRSEPDGLISIAVTRDRKVDLIRDLVASTAIADLEVEEPTLGRIYDWLGAGRQQPAGRLQ